MRRVLRGPPVAGHVPQVHGVRRREPLGHRTPQRGGPGRAVAQHHGGPVRGRALPRRSHATAAAAPREGLHHREHRSPPVSPRNLTVPPVRVESVPATASETSADTSTATAAAGRPRLLLLDGHSLAYRAFFALPVENFSTTTGQHTNAVYGFTAMLINVLRDEQPTHLAVAFDVSRKTFRSEAYSDYKANRSKSPDEFQGQVSLIKEVLNALRVPFVEKDGFEADDIIGTLATQALADDFDVLICSGDRDSFQLVGEHTTVIYPMRGVSEMKRMTPAAVEEKYGVPPDRYPELAALVGESSDNLPGVPGVGPKTAAKWILTYDGLDQRGQPGRGDQGQGRGEPARAPRRRDPQPSAQRPGPRPRPAAQAHRPRRAAVGPPGGAHPLRRPRVPGAARPALRDPRVRGGHRRLRLRARHDAARARAGRRLAGRQRPRPASGSACTSRARGAPAPATCRPSPSRPPRARPPTWSSSR